MILFITTAVKTSNPTDANKFAETVMEALLDGLQTAESDNRWRCT
jgi:hypothetical protein